MILRSRQRYLSFDFVYRLKTLPYRTGSEMYSSVSQMVGRVPWSSAKWDLFDLEINPATQISPIPKNSPAL
jgi:hypothetical protein